MAGRARPASSVGLWFALVSAASFGTSGSLAKGLLDTGWSPGAAVTARIAGGAAVMLVPALVMLRGRWSTLRRNAGMVTVYGLTAVAACQLAYFNAVTTLSVGVALLLEYLGPVLVVGWLWLAHGRRPRPWTLAGIALSLAGLVLVLDVTGGARVDVGGVLWGLAAACGLAVYFVLSARERTDLPPFVLAAGGMCVAALALGLAGVLGLMPLRAGTRDVVLLDHRVSWLVPVLALALVAAVLSYATGIAGTRRLGPTVASFVGLTEVLFAVLLAWLLLGELPLPVQLLGGVLIVAGVVAVRSDELRAVRDRGALAAARASAPEPGRSTGAGRPEPSERPAASPVPAPVPSAGTLPSAARSEGPVPSPGVARLGG